MSYSVEGQLEAAVAESWSVSPDGLQYDFLIREDAKWSDGTPVRAADFVNALRRLLAPESAAPFVSLLLPIANAKRVLDGEASDEELGVVAIDKRNLRITLESPTPYFPQILAHPTTFPIHGSFLNASPTESSGARYITNGAYKLYEWNIGADLFLVRNSHYWDDENTAFDAVQWVAVEGVEETNRYRAGQLDTTQNVASSLFEVVRTERPDELRIAPTLGVYFYGFNFEDPVFGHNRKLRRALSLALDRGVITSQITRRGEEPAYSWVPPGITGYVSPSLRDRDLNQAERERLARQLYEESGFDEEKPFRFELRYNTSDLQETIAVAAQSMWREVLGVEVTLVNEEFKVLLSNIQAGTVTQMFRLSWTGDYNDPAAFLTLMESDSPSNFMRYSSAEVDQLLEQASRINDIETRMRILAEAEAKIMADQPVIPVYFYVGKHLVSKQLVGWSDNVLDIHYSKDLRPSTMD